MFDPTMTPSDRQLAMITMAVGILGVLVCVALFLYLGMLTPTTTP